MSSSIDNWHYFRSPWWTHARRKTARSCWIDWGCRTGIYGRRILLIFMRVVLQHYRFKYVSCRVHILRCDYRISDRTFLLKTCAQRYDWSIILNRERLSLIFDLLQTLAARHGRPHPEGHDWAGLTFDLCSLIFNLWSLRCSNSCRPSARRGSWRRWFPDSATPRPVWQRPMRSCTRYRSEFKYVLTRRILS